MMYVCCLKLHKILTLYVGVNVADSVDGRVRMKGKQGVGGGQVDVEVDTFGGVF